MYRSFILVFNEFLNISWVECVARLAVEHRLQDAAHDDKDQGVQQQTGCGGAAVGGGNPVACDAADQLEGLGVGNDEEGNEGDNLLLNVHLVLFT